MKDKYLFPLNYKYSAKFLGLIEYNVLLPIAIFLGSIALLLYGLKVDFFLSIGIIILLGLPPILILSVGINGQPALPYFKAFIKFYFKNKVYIYK